MKVPNNNSYAQQFLAGYQNLNTNSFGPSFKSQGFNSGAKKPPQFINLAQFEFGSTPIAMPKVSGCNLMA